MAEEHSESHRAGQPRPAEPGDQRADRTAVLLAELRGICERIIASNEGRSGDVEFAAATAATAAALGAATVSPGGDVAIALESLRRESADGRQGLVELRSSVVSLRSDLAEFMADVRHSVSDQTSVAAELSHQLAQRAAVDRSAQLEKLLIEGLPRFAQDLQARLQQELQTSVASLRTDLAGLMDEMRRSVTGQTASNNELARQVAERTARDRSTEIERLLADGLPSFAHQLERRLVDELTGAVDSLRSDLTQGTADGKVGYDNALEGLRSSLAQQAAAERSELQYVLESLRTDLAQQSADLRQEHKESLEALGTDLARQLGNEGDDRRLSLDGLRTDQAQLAAGVADAVVAEFRQALELQRAERADHAEAIVQVVAAGHEDIVRSLAAFGAELTKELTKESGKHLEPHRQQSTGIEQLLRDGLAQLSQDLLDRVHQDVRYCVETLRSDLSELAELVRREAGSQDGRPARPQPPEDRWAEMEQLLANGLPQFGHELRRGVEQTLHSVTLTLIAAEEEHGNRMSELFRAFEASSQRIEAALAAQRRRELNHGADRSPVDPPRDPDDPH